MSQIRKVWTQSPDKMQFQIKNKNKQNKEERMMFKQVFLSEMILVKCAVTLKKSTFI